MPTVPRCPARQKRGPFCSRKRDEPGDELRELTTRNKRPAGRDLGGAQNDRATRGTPTRGVTLEGVRRAHGISREVRRARTPAGLALVRARDARASRGESVSPRRGRIFGARTPGNERSPGDSIRIGDVRRAERSPESSARGMMSPTAGGGKRETVYSDRFVPSRSASAGLQGFNLLDSGDPPASAAHPSSEREVRHPSLPSVIPVYP